MARIDGGAFLMGSEDFYADEGPVQETVVSAFELDLHPVTNAEFAAFVSATGYLTVAERPLDAALFDGVDPADLMPGGLVFTPTAGPVNLTDWRQWWAWRKGAHWRRPRGPGSSIAGMDDHPVVQIAMEDATSYAEWAGKRLPTEPEWEFASRGGEDPRWPFAWGTQPRVDGRLMANSWQGRFPYLNTGADGWVGTSPVGSFPANGYGLVDMIGNVWEWTRTYYAPGHSSDPQQDGDDQVAGCGCGCSPSDTARARSAEPGSATPRRVLKGGSHLCAPEYCLRYRPAARSPQAEDTGSTHIGFRCARDIPDHDG
jgi:formylglycine-generating enzyme